MANIPDADGGEYESHMAERYAMLHEALGISVEKCEEELAKQEQVKTKQKEIEAAKALLKEHQRLEQQRAIQQQQLLLGVVSSLLSSLRIYLFLIQITYMMVLELW